MLPPPQTCTFGRKPTVLLLLLLSWGGNGAKGRRHKLMPQLSEQVTLAASTCGAEEPRLPSSFRGWRGEETVT